MVRRTVRGALGACAIGAAALFAGCGVTDRGDNVVNGKQLFVSKCGSCHILNRAGTKGVTGPNLDQAFARARHDGFGDSTFEGIVHRQIEQPIIERGTGYDLEPAAEEPAVGDQHRPHRTRNPLLLDFHGHCLVPIADNGAGEGRQIGRVAAGQA